MTKILEFYWLTDAPAIADCVRMLHGPHLWTRRCRRRLMRTCPSVMNGGATPKEMPLSRRCRSRRSSSGRAAAQRRRRSGAATTALPVRLPAPAEVRGCSWMRAECAACISHHLQAREHRCRKDTQPARPWHIQPTGAPQGGPTCGGPGVHLHPQWQAAPGHTSKLL